MNMKRIRRGLFVACVFCVVLLLFSFLGNYRTVLPAKTASDAALYVVAKYQVGLPERVDAQRWIVSDARSPKDRTTYLIRAEGQPVARVSLRDFHGLGWQEVGYERLSNDSSQRAGPQAR